MGDATHQRRDRRGEDRRPGTIDRAAEGVTSNEPSPPALRGRGVGVRGIRRSEDRTTVEERAGAARWDINADSRGSQSPLTPTPLPPQSRGERVCVMILTALV